jgi:hypothetical protein
MKHRNVLILLLLCGATIANATVFEQIKSKKMAIAMGVISLHSDTAHHTQTNSVFKDGTLFEVVGASQTLHFDKDENQKFKWYQVKTSNNQKGWIFGDALAILTPPNQLDSLSAKYLFQTNTFSSGFGEAMLWFATVEGIELKGNQYLHNPLYLEQYLVLTNETGKSISLYLSGRGLEGEQQLKSLLFQDLNGDAVQEIIVEKNALNEGRLVDNRSVEAYTFTSAGLTKIFDESLSLKVADDLPSPALYKIVELDNQLIRVSYVDFLDNNNEVTIANFSNAFRLEYVTYTYGWDAASAQFKPLYSESRLPLVGYAKSNYLLYEKPSDASAKITRLVPEAELNVLQSWNETIEKNGETQLKIWLLVENKAGQKGYLSAYQVYFGDAEHATVLHDYFNNPPASLGEWKSDEQFLFVNDQAADNGQNR